MHATPSVYKGATWSHHKGNYGNIAYSVDFGSLRGTLLSVDLCGYQVASLKVHSFDMAYEMYLLLAERFPLRVRAHSPAAIDIPETT